MNNAQILKIPATYMRGGTSKGVFFNLNDLPDFAKQAGKKRDRLLLRIIGSPDSYRKQIDGMGGASSSTSKVVIISRSEREDHDINYLFGQVSIDKDFIDWSGNCGNLTAAVAPFAIEQGLVKPSVQNGICSVRIWQENIQKTIISHVKIRNGQVDEIGDFELDGVAFPAAEIKLEFVAPADEGALFPTKKLIDTLEIPDLAPIPATLINSGIPTIFIRANSIGLTGLELQSDVNSNPELLALFEKIRAYGAMKMGIITQLSDISTHAHTPKIAFVSPAQDYTTSDGKQISKQDIDISVRALSMGQLHHAMMGTAAVAISTAAAIPNTIVSQVAGGERSTICFGHPSGRLIVGAKTICNNGNWSVESVTMSRSARVLMEGKVCVPICQISTE